MRPKAGRPTRLLTPLNQRGLGGGSGRASDRQHTRAPGTRAAPDVGFPLLVWTVFTGFQLRIWMVHAAPSLLVTDEHYNEKIKFPTRMSTM